MNSRNHRKAVGNVCRVVALLAISCAAAVPPAAAFGPPQMLRWEIEATLISKQDSVNIFPEVRLGDPVRGTLMYDAARESDCYSLDCFFGIQNEYEHPRWFDVVTMVIENPRTGGETRFMKDLEADWSDVQVGNNDEENWVVAAQSVISPSPLFSGETPVVLVGLDRAPMEIPDLSLPDELNLDDWPFAKMVFADLFFEDVGGTRLEAEIYSLTPVEVHSLPGDFNYDGNVDGDDYYGWKSSFDSFIDLYADGNVDGIVDAADYIIWRNGVNPTAPEMSANTAVPEPTTLLFAVFVVIPLTWRRRPHTSGHHPTWIGADR